MNFNKITISLNLLTILCVSLFSFLFYTPNFVYAEVPFQNPKVDVLKSEAKSGLNPGSVTDIKVLIGNFVKALIYPMGFIALVLVVVAGFMYMTAMGNAEKTGQSLKIIAWVFLGLIAMTASYMVVASLFKFINLK